LVRWSGEWVGQSEKVENEANGNETGKSFESGVKRGYMLWTQHAFCLCMRVRIGLSVTMLKNPSPKLNPYVYYPEFSQMKALDLINVKTPDTSAPTSLFITPSFYPPKTHQIAPASFSSLGKSARLACRSELPPICVCLMKILGTVL